MNVLRRFLGWNLFQVIVLLCSCIFLNAKVAPIFPGENLWQITKRIGITADTIERKLDELDLSVDVTSKVDNGDLLDEIGQIDSKIDTIERKLDELDMSFDVITDLIDDVIIGLINNVDSKVDDLLDVTGFTASVVDEMQDTTDEILEVTDNINGAVSNIEDIVSTLEEAIGILDSKIDLLLPA